MCAQLQSYEAWFLFWQTLGIVLIKDNVTDYGDIVYSLHSKETVPLSINIKKLQLTLVDSYYLPCFVLIVLHK